MTVMTSRIASPPNLSKGMIVNLPKRFIRALVASFATLVVGLAAGCATPVGGEPVVDVSPRHGNLLRAQELERPLQFDNFRD